MPSDLDPKLLDQRVAQRYLRRGRLDEKAWQKHLDSLPDLADQAMPIESDIDGDDLDDLDEGDDELDAPAQAAGAPGPGEPPQGA